MSGETGLPSINRPSLLDTIETKLEESKGYEGVSRVLYVANISRNSSKQHICNFHKTFLKDIGADASGLMVLQQSTFLNLLEATPDIIAAVMRHLHEEATSDAPSITDVKIVAYVDDCPSRAFMSWSYRSVTLQPETGIDFASEDTVTASFDMYSKLVDLGKLLSDKGNSEVG